MRGVAGALGQAFGLLAVLISFALGAAPAEDQLRDFYSKVQSLDARFDQRLLDEDGQVLEFYSGHFSLARPGRFAWVYESPYPLRLGSDGTTLWHFDPELAQITLRNAGAVLSGTPAELLGGDAAGLANFRISRAEGSDDLEWLELTPNSEDSDFDVIRIGFLDAVPAAMELRDRLGQTTRMAFHEVAVNKVQAASAYVLNIPEGVDIVDDRATPAAP